MGLLALAVHHGGRLVSFDQRLDPQQVPGATAGHLWVIPADADYLRQLGRRDHDS
jgi:hypothetical protein